MQATKHLPPDTPGKRTEQCEMGMRLMHTCGTAGSVNDRAEAVASSARADGQSANMELPESLAGAQREGLCAMSEHLADHEAYARQRVIIRDRNREQPPPVSRRAGDSRRADLTTEGGRESALVALGIKKP